MGSRVVIEVALVSLLAITIRPIFTWDYLFISFRDTCLLGREVLGSNISFSF